MLRIARGERFDIHTTAVAIKENMPIHQCKNCVIATEADVATRQKFRAALADDDVAGDYRLATEFFHAKPFADAVAPVLDTALSFFMSHEKLRVKG